MDSPRKSNVDPVHWVPLGNGHFGLRGRPSGYQVSLLPSMGCTHVVTLQGEREKATQMQDWVTQANMDWIHIPLDNAKVDLLGVEEFLMIVKRLHEISEALHSGAKVLIHCAAGLHRTGTISYILLLWHGHTPQQAIDKIRKAREKTAEGVGESRLTFGRRFIEVCGTDKNPHTEEHIRKNFVNAKSFKSPSKGRRRSTEVKKATLLEREDS